MPFIINHYLEGLLDMKKILKTLFFVFLLLFTSIVWGKTKTMKVLQFNIWQEGTMVDGGFEAIVDEIVRSDADFVMLSEVRNYKNTQFCDRITEALKKRGEIYYSFFSNDSGLLSRYPLMDSITVFPLENDRGSVYKAIAKIKKREIAIYTCHLDYRNCAYYDVLGYDGSTWKKREPVTIVDSILYLNRLSVRDDAIALFIAEAEKDKKAGRLIFLGGDFNEPSHLDWTEATKNLWDHRGAVVPWDVSVMLEKAGYKDVYRVIFPDPITHPGFTFPSDNQLKEISKLTWAPEADERERIDFIYYLPDKKLKPVSAKIVGPSKSIAYGKRVEEITKDIFLKPIGVWPTDHKAVLAVFELKQ